MSGVGQDTAQRALEILPSVFDKRIGPAVDEAVRRRVNGKDEQEV
jgi:hypothetical protein